MSEFLPHTSDEFSDGQSDQPLGIKLPLLPALPLGQTLIRRKFLVPLGARSIAILDPSIFLQRSFDESSDGLFQETAFFPELPTTVNRKAEQFTETGFDLLSMGQQPDQSRSIQADLTPNQSVNATDSRPLKSSDRGILHPEINPHTLKNSSDQSLPLLEDSGDEESITLKSQSDLSHAKDPIVSRSPEAGTSLKANPSQSVESNYSETTHSSSDLELSISASEKSFHHQSSEPAVQRSNNQFDSNSALTADSVPSPLMPSIASNFVTIQRNILALGTVNESTIDSSFSTSDALVQSNQAQSLETPSQSAVSESFELTFTVDEVSSTSNPESPDLQTSLEITGTTHDAVQLSIDAGRTEQISTQAETAISENRDAKGIVQPIATSVHSVIQQKSIDSSTGEFSSTSPTNAINESTIASSSSIASDALVQTSQTVPLEASPSSTSSEVLEQTSTSNEVSSTNNSGSSRTFSEITYQPHDAVQLSIEARKTEQFSSTEAEIDGKRSIEGITQPISTSMQPVVQRQPIDNNTEALSKSSTASEPTLISQSSASNTDRSAKPTTIIASNAEDTIASNLIQASPETQRSQQKSNNPNLASEVAQRSSQIEQDTTGFSEAASIQLKSTNPSTPCLTDSGSVSTDSPNLRSSDSAAFFTTDEAFVQTQLERSNSKADLSSSLIKLESSEARSPQDPSEQSASAMPETTIQKATVDTLQNIGELAEAGDLQSIGMPQVSETLARRSTEQANHHARATAINSISLASNTESATFPKNEAAIISASSETGSTPLIQSSFEMASPEPNSDSGVPSQNRSHALEVSSSSVMQPSLEPVLLEPSIKPASSSHNESVENSPVLESSNNPVVQAFFDSTSPNTEPEIPSQISSARLEVSNSPAVQSSLQNSGLKGSAVSEQFSDSGVQLSSNLASPEPKTDSKNSSVLKVPSTSTTQPFPDLNSLEPNTPDSLQQGTKFAGSSQNADAESSTVLQTFSTSLAQNSFNISSSEPSDESKISSQKYSDILSDFSIQRSSDSASSAIGSEPASSSQPADAASLSITEITDNSVIRPSFEINSLETNTNLAATSQNTRGALGVSSNSSGQQLSDLVSSELHSQSANSSQNANIKVPYLLEPSSNVTVQLSSEISPSASNSDSETSLQTNSVQLQTSSIDAQRSYASDSLDLSTESESSSQSANTENSSIAKTSSDPAVQMSSEIDSSETSIESGLSSQEHSGILSNFSIQRSSDPFSPLPTIESVSSSQSANTENSSIAKIPGDSAVQSSSEIVSLEGSIESALSSQEHLGILSNSSIQRSTNPFSPLSTIESVSSSQSANTENPSPLETSGDSAVQRSSGIDSLETSTEPKTISQQHSANLNNSGIHRKIDPGSPAPTIESVSFSQSTNTASSTALGKFSSSIVRSSSEISSSEINIEPEISPNRSAISEISSSSLIQLFSEPASSELSASTSQGHLGALESLSDPSTQLPSHLVSSKPNTQSAIASQNTDAEKLPVLEAPENLLVQRSPDPSPSLTTLESIQPLQGDVIENSAELKASSDSIGQTSSNPISPGLRTESAASIISRKESSDQSLPFSEVEIAGTEAQSTRRVGDLGDEGSGAIAFPETLLPLQETPPQFSNLQRQVLDSTSESNQSNPANSVNQEAEYSEASLPQVLQPLGVLQRLTETSIPSHSAIDFEASLAVIQRASDTNQSPTPSVRPWKPVVTQSSKSSVQRSRTPSSDPIINTSIQPKLASESESVSLFQSTANQQTETEIAGQIEALAQVVYHQLKRRLRIEQERHGRDYSGQLPW